MTLTPLDGVDPDAVDGVEPDADEQSIDELEPETAGTETEDDVENADTLDFRDVVLAPSDWTVQTILTQLQSGSFELDPDFQRRNAWTDSRRSKFIESLLLGLPIPQIVLAEKESDADDDRYIVIDGKQRLLALEAFHSTDRPLRLSGLTVLKDLNGRTRVELMEDPLQRRVVSRLDNRTIRTVVIRKWREDAFLHLVFHRINHQTLSLSAQELRQALHPGRFTKFADTFAGRSVPLHRVLGASQQPDFRMRDVELLVRHLSYRYRLGEYSGNLKKFLDEACQEFNVEWDSMGPTLEAAATECEGAIEATETIFGRNAFRRRVRSGWESRFNRAVFDAMTYYFADPWIRDASLAKAEDVVVEFERLSLEDETFATSLATTTKTLRATAYRLEAWGRTLENVLESEISVPTLNESTRRIEIPSVSI